MAEPPLDQTVWGRAKYDTIGAAHTLRFKALEAVSAPVSVALAATLAPTQWSNGTTAWFAAGVGIVTAVLVVGLVYLRFLVVASFRQRDEARAFAFQTKSDEVSSAMVKLKLAKLSQGNEDTDALKVFMTLAEDLALGVGRHYIDAVLERKLGQAWGYKADDILVALRLANVVRSEYRDGARSDSTGMYGSMHAMPDDVYYLTELGIDVRGRVMDEVFR